MYVTLSVWVPQCISIFEMRPDHRFIQHQKGICGKITKVTFHYAKYTISLISFIRDMIFEGQFIIKLS